MFDDLGTLCLLGIFLIVGFMLLSRFMGSRGGLGGGGTDFSQRGPINRTVDNPEVRSRGSFGRPGPFLRRSSGSARSAGRTDNPEVRSRGSFGRGKK